MEASALTHAQKRGLFARRSPLLRFQDDAHLVALTRRGHQHAFDALVERYQSRLLGFCRQMLGSTEDAEDVLQEVFVAAYNAMIADEREIAVRPWLYRIARNRCLNHLRKPTADGQDTMDTMPHMNGVTTLERVQNREEFRSLLEDVSHLPETQRSALLLREIDAMSYEEIAQAMDTTVPGVKSLLVRARIALAESTQARQLTCDEVRVQLAEAAEGLAKLDGPARRHVKECEPCADFRKQLRKDSKVLAALFPAGPLLALKGLVVGKLTGLIGGGGGASRRCRRRRGRGSARPPERTRRRGGAAAVGGAAAAARRGSRGWRRCRRGRRRRRDRHQGRRGPGHRRDPRRRRRRDQARDFEGHRPEGERPPRRPPRPRRSSLWSPLRPPHRRAGAAARPGARRRAAGRRDADRRGRRRARSPRTTASTRQAAVGPARARRTRSRSPPPTATPTRQPSAAR